MSESRHAWRDVVLPYFLLPFLLLVACIAVPTLWLVMRLRSLLRSAPGDERGHG